MGVWGIRPQKGDFVVAQALVRPEATLCVIGENGIGKRTGFEDYRVQKRGGKGIITMKTTEKTGKVVDAISVGNDDEIMLITNGGQMVRIKVAEIRETGRNASGVKLINLKTKEKVQDVATVVTDEDEEEELEEGEEPESTLPAQ
jgi:DNA gyrase subunit A